MAFNTVLYATAALLSTTALAQQVQTNTGPTLGGWCTFHIDEDAVPAPGIDGPEHNFEGDFYDINGNTILHKNKNNYGDDLQGIVVELSDWGAPENIVMNSLKDGRDGDYIQGWEFVYGDETWTTNDERHCSVGEEVKPSAIRRKRSYDCGYTC